MSNIVMPCYSIAEEVGCHEHCPVCHWDNIFDDEVLTTEYLVDGRSAEVCCPIRKKLLELGLLKEKS